jgi:hypothetical protein
MKFSQGASYDKYSELYHPEIFNDREEVIVFRREDFASVFKSMMNQIEFIEDIDLKFNRQDDYKLLGLWPQIMNRVHIIDVNMESILTKEPSLQSYLDASIYNTIKTTHKNVTTSKKKVEVQLTLPI